MESVKHSGGKMSEGKYIEIKNVEHQKVAEPQFLIREATITKIPQPKYIVLECTREISKGGKRGEE